MCYSVKCKMYLNNENTTTTLIDAYAKDRHFHFTLAFFFIQIVHTSRRVAYSLVFALLHICLHSRGLGTLYVIVLLTRQCQPKTEEKKKNTLSCGLVTRLLLRDFFFFHMSCHHRQASAQHTCCVCFQTAL